MRSFDEVVANNIICKLREQNKKQSELATSLNMPRQTINKMLTGKRTISAMELDKIASFFSCTFDDLTIDNNTTSDVEAYFMGNISNVETKDRVSKIYELSKIIADQQYANLNK